MKKNEFAVGEVFQLGLRKLKVVEVTPSLMCMDCYFQDLCTDKDVTEMVGECFSTDRDDGKNVQFVEVEEDQCEK